MRIVVLAIGNLLRADEGVGPHALSHIRRWPLADCVECVDGGVLGLDLLYRIEGCDLLLMIDAVNTGQPPGTVVRLEGDELPAVIRQKLSMHQAGLADLLGVMELCQTAPRRLILWGVVPHTIDWALELSPGVAAALLRMLDGVRGDLNAVGALPADSNCVAQGD